MALRIVLDARRLKDFGVGTYIRNLTRGLADVDRKNHYILVARPEDAADLAGFPDNFEIVPYESPDSSILDNLRFPLFLRRFHADLFHIPLFTAPLLMPKPYVVTVHDLSLFLYEGSSDWRHTLRLYQARRSLQRADRVIAVSAATRRDVENLLGIAPDKIRQIYNAPDPRFIEQPTAGDARAGGPDRQRRYRERILERYQIKYPFILYVGNIRPQKNIPRLIEAFAVLRGELVDHDKYSDLRLIIIGDEISRYPAVRLAAMQSRVEKAVRFLGFVPIDTLRVFYQVAAVFAFPSLYEGFGLPPLEAMAAGTPVVTSNVSSLPEVVGDAAVVVNPDNVFDIARGLRDALLDEDLRQTLIARGFEQVKQFNWHTTAEEVLDTYYSIAGTTR